MNQLLPTPSRPPADPATVLPRMGRPPGGARRWALAALIGCVALLAGVPTAGAAGTGSIEGTVFQEDGVTPLANIEVEVLTLSHEFAGFASTNVKGEYTVAGLAAGSYKVEFYSFENIKWADQFYTNKQTFAAATPVLVEEAKLHAGINATLLEGGTFTGTVTDTEGHHVENVGVEANNQEFFPRFTATEGGGKYELKGLVGEYKIGFFPAKGNLVPQYFNGTANGAPTLAAAKGEIATEKVLKPNINAELQVGGVITGTVTDAATHKPLANVVLVVATNALGFEYFGGFAETNANGEYEMVGLGTGAYNLEFFTEEPPGAVQYIAQTVNGIGVTQKSTTAGISVALVRKAPVNTAAPGASGIPAVAQTLSCSTGSWTGIATLKYTYRWLRDGVAIAGAAGSTYVVQAADRGHGLACEVTATNSIGNAAASSNTLKVPAPPPPVPVITLTTSKVVVSGNAAKVGIACAAAPCSGSIELVKQVVVKHRKGKRTISRKKTLVLAKGSYSLAAGQSGTFTIKLTGTGKSTLAHANHHRLSATLEASVSGGASVKKTVAVSETKPKHKKRR